MKSFKTIKGRELRSLETTGLMDTQSSSAAMTKNDFYGVRQIGNSITFAAFYPDACKVQLAGNFNNWQPERDSMKKVGNEGDWQLTLRLRPGTYCYRLVIDGKWQQDPSNKSTEPNPYGELNSVLTVS